MMLAVPACSAPEPELAGRGDHPSESGQALDLPSDRPAAAAVGVLGAPAPTSPGHAARARQLWLFACSRDHRLQRRVRADRDARWGAWTVESSVPCAGTPSASSWSVSPHDHVEVVYRSSDNRLIELFYQGDQVAEELDLSTYSRFGSLASNCNPVIADLDDAGRVSIAVRNPLNQLFTFTAYRNTWHVQPMQGPKGAQAFAESTLVAWYSDRSAYVSATHDGATQVFKRYTWKQSFRAINTPIPGQAAHGLITFTERPTGVQAVARDANGALISSFIDRAWNFVPTPGQSLIQSTVYLSSPYAHRSAKSAHSAAVALEAASNEPIFMGFDSAKQPLAVAPNVHIASANALVTNAGTELEGENLVADADDQLLWWNGNVDAPFTPMDLRVVY